MTKLSFSVGERLFVIGVLGKQTNMERVTFARVLELVKKLAFTEDELKVIKFVTINVSDTNAQTTWQPYPDVEYELSSEEHVLLKDIFSKLKYSTIDGQAALDAANKLRKDDA